VFFFFGVVFCCFLWLDVVVCVLFFFVFCLCWGMGWCLLFFLVGVVLLFLFLFCFVVFCFVRFVRGLRRRRARRNGWNLDDTVAFARELKARGVDVIDCSSGGISGSANRSASPRAALGFSGGPMPNGVRKEVGNRVDGGSASFSKRRQAGSSF